MCSSPGSPAPRAAAPASFPSFPRLPLELRLRIWRETCHPARMLELWSDPIMSHVVGAPSSSSPPGPEGVMGVLGAGLGMSALDAMFGEYGPEETEGGGLLSSGEARTAAAAVGGGRQTPGQKVVLFTCREYYRSAGLEANSPCATQGGELETEGEGGDLSEARTRRERLRRRRRFVPALMHVSRESRREGMAVYRRGLATAAAVDGGDAGCCRKGMQGDDDEEGYPLLFWNPCWDTLMVSEIWKGGSRRDGLALPERLGASCPDKSRPVVIQDLAIEAVCGSRPTSAVGAAARQHQPTGIATTTTTTTTQTALAGGAEENEKDPFEITAAEVASLGSGDMYTMLQRFEEAMELDEAMAAAMEQGITALDDDAESEEARAPAVALVAAGEGEANNDDDDGADEADSSSWTARFAMALPSLSQCPSRPNTDIKGLYCVSWAGDDDWDLRELVAASMGPELWDRWAGGGGGAEAGGRRRRRHPALVQIAVGGGAGAVLDIAVYRTVGSGGGSGNGGGCALVRGEGEGEDGEVVGDGEATAAAGPVLLFHFRRHVNLRIQDTSLELCRDELDITLGPGPPSMVLEVGDAEMP